jgi:hypothetical protein
MDCDQTAMSRQSRLQYFSYLSHYHHPPTPPSGVGTTWFFLAFYSITRHLHAHSFYSHVIIHTVHPSFLRSTTTLGCPSIIILITLFVVTFGGMKVTTKRTYLNNFGKMRESFEMFLLRFRGSSVKYVCMKNFLLKVHFLISIFDLTWVSIGLIGCVLSTLFKRYISYPVRDKKCDIFVIVLYFWHT